MTTKRIVRDANFIRAAAADPLGSLAYTLMSSFGVTMDVVLTVMEKIVATQDSEVLSLALASTVTIRGNVSHVQNAHIRAQYPELIISGDRATGDVLNFSALRMVGFGFAAKSNTSLASKISNKAGNAVSGGQFPATAAGKINKEAYEAWSQGEKDMFAARNIVMAWVNSEMMATEERASAFAGQLQI